MSNKMDIFASFSFEEVPHIVEGDTISYFLRTIHGRCYIIAMMKPSRCKWIVHPIHCYDETFTLCPVKHMFSVFFGPISIAISTVKRMQFLTILDFKRDILYSTELHAELVRNSSCPNRLTSSALNLLVEILEVDIITVPDFPGDLTDPPTVIVEGVHYLVHVEKAKAAPSQLSSVNRNRPLPFGSRTQVVNEENNNFSSHRKKEEATVYSKSRSQSSVAVFPSLHTPTRPSPSAGRLRHHTLPCPTTSRLRGYTSAPPPLTPLLLSGNRLAIERWKDGL
nr:hypothetical protein Itr_chr09CG17330 [Ipomoea trifida]